MKFPVFFGVLSFALLFLPAGAGAQPDDFQRFELNLSDIDNKDMTLHLNYQDGGFLQGWIEVDGEPVSSHIDVSELSLHEGAITALVDVTFVRGRRNNRFYVIEIDAVVDGDYRVSGEYQAQYGLEIGHTYGSGYYIFTDDTLDHDTPVVTMDQLRFLRSGDEWSGPAEGALEAAISADEPVRFELDMGQVLRGPSATAQRVVLVDLVLKGDEVISVDAFPRSSEHWRLVDDIEVEASFDGERITGEMTIDVEASYPWSGEYQLTFEGDVKNHLVQGQISVYHERPHGYHGTREVGHSITGTAELANGATRDPANAIHRITFKPSQGVDMDFTAVIQMKDGQLAGATVEPIYRGGGMDFPTRMLNAEVHLEDDRLQGTLLIDPTPRSYPDEWGHKEHGFDFDVRIEDGHSTGTYISRFDRTFSSEGAVTGRQVDTAELRTANPAPEVDWPTWHGPKHSMSAADTDTPLIDDFSQARMLWKSERTPPARSQIQRYGTSNLGRNMRGGPGGGAGSPVVYDGKVYLHYYEPSGEASTALSVAEGYGRQFEESWRILADDVVVCIDLETGATLWKQRFEQTGLNYYNTWKDAPGSTASVGEGKVFAAGSGGYLWAMDADSGEVLWESTMPGFYEGRQRTREESLRENSRPHSGGFNAGTRIVVDGLLVGSNFGGDLVAIDTETGEKRWRVEGVIATQNTPSLWQGHSEPVVIVHNGNTLSAVTVAEGEVLWEKEVARIPRAYPLPVEGDILTVIVEAENGEDYHLAGFRIHSDRPERLWTLEKKQDKTGRRLLMAHDGNAYAFGQEGSEHDHLYRVNLETGQYTYLSDLGPLGSMSFVVGVGDRVMFDRNNYRWIDADDDFRRTSDYWDIPIMTSRGYHSTQLSDAIVDGRLIVRGGDGIYAFDLRAQDD
ncbi:MAG: PQQ-like beta-propeller repeat protein [Opitutales bacterium]|nr:PQQ-like beta-propeller repeat protein [Opitutales bacterium]MCH8540017.1 PQQ-binding-like beta-propeller repeat protein [Opitutales bacterium]